MHLLAKIVLYLSKMHRKTTIKILYILWNPCLITMFTRTCHLLLSWALKFKSTSSSSLLILSLNSLLFLKWYFTMSPVVIFLHYVQEVLGSIHGPQIDYLDLRYFMVFLSLCRYSLYNMSYLFIHSSSQNKMLFTLNYWLHH